MYLCRPRETEGQIFAKVDVLTIDSYSENNIVKNHKPVQVPQTTDSITLVHYMYNYIYNYNYITMTL